MTENTSQIVHDKGTLLSIISKALADQNEAIPKLALTNISEVSTERCFDVVEASLTSIEL